MRHRTIRSKGCLSNKTAPAMVFKLIEAAQKSWRCLDGHNQLPKLITGVMFADEIEVVAQPARLSCAAVSAGSAGAFETTGISALGSSGARGGASGTTAGSGSELVTGGAGGSMMTERVAGAELPQVSVAT